MFQKPSKHRQFDRDGNWIEGECKVADNTGLRKLMRAARHGTIPPERMGIITRAKASAELNCLKYITGRRRVIVKVGNEFEYRVAA